MESERAHISNGSSTSSPRNSLCSKSRASATTASEASRLPYPLPPSRSDRRLRLPPLSIPLLRLPCSSRHPRSRDDRTAFSPKSNNSSPPSSYSMLLSLVIRAEETVHPRHPPGPQSFKDHGIHYRRPVVETACCTGGRPLLRLRTCGILRVYSFVLIRYWESSSSSSAPDTNSS